MFPSTRLEKKAVDYISTTKGGYNRDATRSRQPHNRLWFADEIIIDDPMQPEDIHSENAKISVKELDIELGSDPLQQARQGRLIIVMDGGDHDPSADMERSADFVLKLPFIAEDTEKFRMGL